MPSLYRPQLLLRVSKNISKSMHRRWSIFCIKLCTKQCIKADYLSLHAMNQPHLGVSAVCRGHVRRCRKSPRLHGPPIPPASAGQGHVDMPETAEAAGPTCPNGDRRRHLPPNMPALGMAAPPCRRWPRRHVPRVAWPDVLPPLGGPF
jgi:hypothetical protein